MVGWTEGIRPSRVERGERIFGLMETLRIFGRDYAARMSGLVENVRILRREYAARIFGWGGPEVDERAKLINRMVALIVHGLQTKTYDEFVATFSNPGCEPDALKRLSRRANFQMRISPTCWYDASICYPRDGSRSLSIAGGGDDLGVCLTAGSAIDGIGVEYTALYGEESGRDAWAMVRALAKLPGYHRVDKAETSLEV